MRTTGINKLIDDFIHLPLEDKELAADIISKHLVESKRVAIFKRSRQAESNLKKGAVKRGGVKRLYEDLE